MNSVFSFSELGSIFEDARADFLANFRAARAVRGLPSGNYRLRIVSCVFSGTPGRDYRFEGLPASKIVRFYYPDGTWPGMDENPGRLRDTPPAPDSFADRARRRAFRPSSIQL